MVDDSFGKYSGPKISFELNESPFTIRLINNVYNASIIPFIAELDAGEYIFITTTHEQLKKSTSKNTIDKILNYMFKWYKQPLIYSIKTSDIAILTLEKYLDEKKKSNYNYVL